MTPPRSAGGAGPELGLTNTIARGLGALLSGLSSACCVFDGHAHTDTIVSTAPHGHPGGNPKERAKQNGEEKKQRNKQRDEKKGKKEMKGKRGKPVQQHKNPHTGGGSIYRSRVSAGGLSGTAPPRGTEQALKRTNTRTKTQVTYHINSRRQYLGGCVERFYLLVGLLP